MQAIDNPAIAQMEQRYRATFINSLWGFRPLALIGTCDQEKRTNLAIFNSLVHIGANPPLFGLVVRPDSVDRHTLDNIRERKEFTVNLVGKDFVAQAHQTSARYPKDVSEFEATGLETEWKEGIDVPFVLKSSIQIHAKLVEEHSLAINGTEFLIAQVSTIYIHPSCIGADGFVDHLSAQTAAGIGLDAYYAPELIMRLPYAKPK